MAHHSLLYVPRIVSTAPYRNDIGLSPFSKFAIPRNCNALFRHIGAHIIRGATTPNNYMNTMSGLCSWVLHRLVSAHILLYHRPPFTCRYPPTPIVVAASVTIVKSAASLGYTIHLIGIALYLASLMATSINSRSVNIRGVISTLALDVFLDVILSQPLRKGIMYGYTTCNDRNCPTNDCNTRFFILLREYACTRTALAFVKYLSIRALGISSVHLNVLKI